MAVGMRKGVIYNDLGLPFSKWLPTDKFDYVLETEGIKGGDHIKEYKFHETRGWAFDHAWPSCMVAVEIDGFGYGHQAQQCMAEDNEKANAAIELGWKVLRYNSRQLGSKAGLSEAVEQICRVLCGAV